MAVVLSLVLVPALTTGDPDPMGTLVALGAAAFALLPAWWALSGVVLLGAVAVLTTTRPLARRDRTVAPG